MPALATIARLAIATARDYPALGADDDAALIALEGLGIQTTVCVWNDPDIDWGRYDAVLMRTIWDYFKHYDDFLHWLDRLDRLGVATINPSALLRWNSDKRYLQELAQHGVGIIPTRIARARELPALLATLPGQQLVVKPTISGGAWHTLQGRVGEAAFDAAVMQLPDGHDFLVQPFVAEIVSDGEWSLLYFGGTFSHAVIKRPAHGDYRVQGEFGGSAEPLQPSATIRDAADHALASVARLGHPDHAYVRVDGVLCSGRFLIMELEMIEPFLHLDAHPQAAERFATQVAGQLARRKASQATPV